MGKWLKPRSSPGSPARTAPTWPSCCSTRATTSIGLHRRSSTVTFERIAHLIDRMTLVAADLLDEASMIRVLRDHRPGRGLQPGRPVLRADLVRPAGPHRRGHRPRRHPPARRHPARRPVHPLLPGQLQRDVRQGRRDAADARDAVLSPQPLRGGQGLRPLDHRQLPGELRPARQLGHPVQPREPAPGPGVRHPQGDLQRGARSSSDSRRTSSSATSTPSGTGASPPTTSGPCG